MTPACRPGWTPTLCSVLLISLCSLNAADWYEITPEEFALKEPVVDPEYGAEILFSESSLKQTFTAAGYTSGSFQIYNRIKIFNQKGIEQLSNTKLTYSKGREISRVEGRTVKPDGTIINLEKDSIFDQEVIRKGRSNLRAKTFAYPGLEPGDIVELQYSQRTGGDAFLVEVGFLSSLPAQRVKRLIKPFEVNGLGNKISAFQFPGADLSPNKRGYYEFELRNLPAKKSEPFAPPDLHEGPHVVLYYYYYEPKNDVYWSARSTELYKEGRSALKPSKDIEKFVKSHTEDETSDLERLRKLYYYCQQEITNHDYSYGVYTSKELEDLTENRSAQHTFSRGHGTPENINALYGAMARALGLNAQIANGNDNRFMIFGEGAKVGFALREPGIGVEMDGSWHFFNPGNPFLAFDSVEWWSCDSMALVGQPKKGELISVPMPRSDYSTRFRKGDFSVDELGHLKGTVTIEYSGFQNLDMKEGLSSRLGDEAKEKWILQELKENQQRASGSNFSFKNRGSSANNLLISFDLEIPDFADVTGKRIFLQTAVFHKGAEAIFTEDKRYSDIVFPYPWTEVDEISLKLPEGFELEEGSSPPSLNLGALGVYDAKLSIQKESNTVFYRRKFGVDMRILPQPGYLDFKTIFSYINQLDQHALIFKRVEEASE
jgi:hypothetical protein